MENPTRSAEDHSDYRFFRFLTLGGAKVVVVCLILIAWNLLFFRQWETLIFLGNSALVALALSLVSGFVAYGLFKRRGGKVEKTPPPTFIK